jgi:hypothetical protein
MSVMIDLRVFIVVSPSRLVRLLSGQGTLTPIRQQTPLAVALQLCFPSIWLSIYPDGLGQRGGRKSGPARP